MQTIKRLSNSTIKDIELRNYARRLAGLNPIRILIFRCLECNNLFESIGSMICKCGSNKVVEE